MEPVMPFKVPLSKLHYSAKPQNPRLYTDRMNRVYTRYAEAYNLSVKLVPVWKKWLKKVIPCIEGDRVLEASFGTGYLLTQYADRFDTWGIDYNETMLSVAKRNLEAKGMNASLNQANVEALPFKANQFDCIVNTMAFSGYPDGRKAMAEFRRVLKPGGRLVLMDFNYPANRNWAGYIMVKMMEDAGDTIKDIASLLELFGFEYSEEEVGGFGSVHLYVGTSYND